MASRLAPQVEALLPFVLAVVLGTGIGALATANFVTNETGLRLAFGAGVLLLLGACFLSPGPPTLARQSMRWLSFVAAEGVLVLSFYGTLWALS